MKEIIMATNNAGKVKEMQSLFAELNIKVLALKDVFSEPIDVEENGTTGFRGLNFKRHWVS